MKNEILLLGALCLGFSSMAQTPQNGLKVCMPFSGNANDLSGNNNHGTVSGTVTLSSDRFGNPNSSYQFNAGTNDFIAINTFSNAITANELSIIMWARVDYYTSTCLFMLSPDNASDRCVGCAQYSGVGLVWDYGDIFNNGRVTKSMGQDLGWHHYAFLVSQSGNKKEVYVDGVLQISAAYGSSLMNKSLPLYIGAGTSDVGGGSLRWPGKIDDVLIYNRALSANEITAVFNSTITCATITGLPESPGTARVLFYPSVSADGSFTCGAELSTLESVLVFNMEGKVVRQFQKADFTTAEFLHLTDLQAGLYYVRTSAGGSQSVQKLMITGN